MTGAWATILSVGRDRRRFHAPRQLVAAGSAGLRRIAVPSAPAAVMVCSGQATATGGPRKRSIRRRIAANRARGTTTSASWQSVLGSSVILLAVAMAVGSREVLTLVAKAA